MAAIKAHVGVRPLLGCSYFGEWQRAISQISFCYDMKLKLIPCDSAVRNTRGGSVTNCDDKPQGKLYLRSTVWREQTGQVTPSQQSTTKLPPSMPPTMPPTTPLKHLMDMSMKDLKALAAERGVTPIGDKRKKQSWIDALAKTSGTKPPASPVSPPPAPPSPPKSAPSPSDSCKEFGCGRYRRWRSCQCNSKCQRYKNCCEDYATVCNKQSD